MNQVKRVCVAFNGPPGIGKDTIAIQMNKLLPNLGIGAFADKVREQAAEYLGRPDFVGLATDQTTKDKPFHSDGMTPRQFLAIFSARMKDARGINYFFDMSMQDTYEYDNFLFTDIGFDYEARKLEDHFDAVIIVSLHHPDFNFDNDVRKYVFHQTDKTRTVSYIVNRRDAECDKNAKSIIDLVQRTAESILGL